MSRLTEELKGRLFGVPDLIERIVGAQTTDTAFLAFDKKAWGSWKADWTDTSWGDEKEFVRRADMRFLPRRP